MKWSSDNMLPLNFSIIKVMKFGKNLSNCELFVEGGTCKTCGGTSECDDKMAFSQHREKQINKASGVRVLPNRAFKYLSIDTYQMLYKVFNSPITRVWAPIDVTNSRRIERVQNKCL